MPSGCVSTGEGHFNPPGFLEEVVPELSSQRFPMALFLPTLRSLLFPMEISVCASRTDYEEGLYSQGRGANFGMTVPLQAGLSCFSKFLVSKSDDLLCSTVSGCSLLPG